MCKCYTKTYMILLYLLYNGLFQFFCYSWTKDSEHHITRGFLQYLSQKWCIYFNFRTKAKIVYWLDYIACTAYWNIARRMMTDKFGISILYLSMYWQIMSNIILNSSWHHFNSWESGLEGNTNLHNTNL